MAGVDRVGIFALPISPTRRKCANAPTVPVAEAS